MDYWISSSYLPVCVGEFEAFGYENEMNSPICTVGFLCSETATKGTCFPLDLKDAISDLGVCLRCVSCFDNKKYIIPSANRIYLDTSHDKLCTTGDVTEADPFEASPNLVFELQAG